MKQIQISNEAYKKIMKKKEEWGFNSLSDFLLGLLESQKELQNCYWNLIEGKTNVENERKALHWPENFKY